MLIKVCGLTSLTSFADDATANYPGGTFVGKASIREHLYRNVGAMAMFPTVYEFPFHYANPVSGRK
jgi:hypothetical protein